MIRLAMCSLALLVALVAPLAQAQVKTEAPQVAIVIQDRAPLRAAVRESAPQHAVLWAGDTLEVRGRRLDFLQVYDHRRERAGFVRASQLRLLTLTPEHADEFLAVLGFLRDSPGAESLGIAYAAAYLRAAAPEAIGPDLFDALGTLADRLARRASANQPAAMQAVLAAHLEVVASYGVVIRSFEGAGRMQLCYDGEAFRRVLALNSMPEQKARAALALTRPECVDPALTPLARHDLDVWRAEVLDRVPRSALPEHVRNRLRLRSAAVWSSLAFQLGRRGKPAQTAASRALQELAGVNQAELAEEDLGGYREAAVRVGASRWAAEPAATLPIKLIPGKLALRTRAGEPGQTCIELLDQSAPKPTLLLQRCTYATVWTNSTRVNAQGSALVLAVQPLAGWREMWVFQKGGQKGESGWRVDVVPPGSDTPELGYVEFAGWVPGSKKLLAARELRQGGQVRQSFEVLDLQTLNVDKRADKPDYLSLFYRWQDPQWKQQTVSLR